jgi:hypothetical protein
MLNWPRKEFFLTSLISQLYNDRNDMLRRLKSENGKDICEIINDCRVFVTDYYQLKKRPKVSKSKITGTVRTDIGMIESIDIEFDNGSAVSLLIGIPKSNVKPKKTIIGLHGTHESKEYYLGMLSGKARKGHMNSVDFLVPLLKEGYVVVCPDLPTFGSGYPGDRNDNKTFTDYITQVDVLSRLIGRCYAAEAIGDVMGVMDFLESYPLTQGSCYGIIGFSLGGQISSLVAACDARINAVIDVAGLLTYEQVFKIWPEKITKITYIFGGDCLGSIGDLWSIALAIAPRPQLRMACTNDEHVPIQSVYDINELLQSAYESLCVKGMVKFIEYIGPHDIQHKMIYDAIAWLDKNLSGGVL